MTYFLELQHEPDLPLDLDLIFVHATTGEPIRMDGVEHVFSMRSVDRQCDWPCDGWSVVATTSNGMISNLEPGVLSISIPSFPAAGLPRGLGWIADFRLIAASPVLPQTFRPLMTGTIFFGDR